MNNSNYLIVLILIGLTFSSNFLFAQSPLEPSAIMDVESTQQGVLIPRMSTTERESIPSPANSLMVFDEDKAKFYFYDQTEWKVLGPTQKGHGCTNVVDHGAQADRLTDNTSLINALIIQLNLESTVNGINLGWELCIPKNVLFDYDGLINLPDDYLIFDNSTFDWQRYGLVGVNPSTLWTAQNKIIMHTSNPGMKNANETLIMADYHPAITVDNTYDYANPANEDYQASIVFSSSGDRKWRLGMGTLGNPDLVLAGRSPAPANNLTARMHVKDDFGNFGFNSFSVQGIDYQFGDSDDSNPLNFKFLSKQDEITWLFHHNGNAAVSTSRIKFDNDGKISILQGGNFGTTFGPNQSIYAFRKEIMEVNSNVTLSKDDNYKVITNTGTNNLVEIILPETSIPGNHIRFVVTENQAIRISPMIGDQFRAAVGYLESSVAGSSIELYSVVDGIWEINVIQGTWY